MAQMLGQDICVGDGCTGPGDGLDKDFHLLASLSVNCCSYVVSLAICRKGDWTVDGLTVNNHLAAGKRYRMTLFGIDPQTKRKGRQDMNVVSAGYQILEDGNMDDFREKVYRKIERIGRTCYKSENGIKEGSAEKFVRKLVEDHHEAMLEHAHMTVLFRVDRGVSHELVRHRMASFAQESTRYCNYSKDKFGTEITVIEPFMLDKGTIEYDAWYDACKKAEDNYFLLLGQGMRPEVARDVLPNSLKTEIVVTANMREWRHIFKLRAAGYTGTPHPQMAQVMIPLMMNMQSGMPELFGDIELQPCIYRAEWAGKLGVLGYNE